MKTIRSILLVLCLLSLSIGTAMAQGEIKITITDLGTLGGQRSGARSINNLGQVVGTFCITTFVCHAFLWTAETGMIDLGTLGGPGSSAAAINDLGQVVGSSDTANGERHVFLWTKETGMTDLGTLEGTNRSFATDINNRGQVVGFGERRIPYYAHAFLWTAETGIMDLGLRGSINYAFSINDLGQVVGENGTAFLWTAEAGAVDLGKLSDDEWSTAESINNLGQVVGESYRVDPIWLWRPFLWTAETGMTDLGTFGGDEGGALDINNHGQVVGYSTYSTTPSGGGRAFLWTTETGMIDLGTLGGNDGWAHSINDHGQVVGQSQTAAGDYHATLWTINPLSPEDQTKALKEQVSGFVAAGKLNKGQGNALTVKLNNVLTQLAKNKTVVACNSLKAFTNQVQSFIVERVLSLADGQSLINSADAIKKQLCQ